MGKELLPGVATDFANKHLSCDEREMGIKSPTSVDAYKLSQKRSNGIVITKDPVDDWITAERRIRRRYEIQFAS